MRCSKCGKQIESGTQFCPHCGTRQGATAGDVPAWARREKKNRSRTWAWIAGGVILALLAIGSLSSRGSGNNAASQTATNAPSAPASATTLLDVKSSGIHKTRKFTTSGDEWQIRWHYNCASTLDGKGNFQVYVYDSSGVPDVAVNELGTSGSGVEYEHSGGIFYLEMNSECTWRVSVRG